jgi:hypothetical protein
MQCNDLLNIAKCRGRTDPIEMMTTFIKFEDGNRDGYGVLSQVGCSGPRTHGLAAGKDLACPRMGLSNRRSESFILVGLASKVKRPRRFKLLIMSGLNIGSDIALRPSGVDIGLPHQQALLEGFMTYEPKNYDHLKGGALKGFSDSQLELHFTLYKGYLTKLNEIEEKLVVANNTKPNYSFNEYS